MATTYPKPSVRSAWGLTATVNDLQDPGNTYASAGWQLGNKPPRQYDNWVLNYVFAGIRYFCQSGIPAWDATENYHPGSIVTSNNGVIYRALSPGVGVNPDTTGPDEANWDVPYVNTIASGSDRSIRVTNSAWVGANFLPVGSTFNAIGGSISNAQVPVGAVTQWQGSLTISGSQISGAVSEANQWFLSGVGYVQPQWVGNTGQPSWLFGSSIAGTIQVWNPSNFSVANATTVAGLSVQSGAAGNTVMARDANGYAYAQYFNQASSNNENPGISQFLVTNGTDGFIRKSSVAATIATLVANGVTPLSSFVESFGSNGYQKIPGGFILQWVSCNPNGGSQTVGLPIAFPNACLSALSVGRSSPVQCNVTSFTNSTITVYTSGGAAYAWALGF